MLENTQSYASSSSAATYTPRAENAAEEKSIPKHFFGQRTNGLDISVNNSSWRYGKGNVFFPAEEHPENSNAVSNVIEILKEFKFEDVDHPGVFLQTQYKKGISVVDETFLNNQLLTRDRTGRIIINGDGLFTTLKHVPLLNKSGDAHAIIFESEKAVGILVGAWRCLGQDIINLMLDHFKNAHVPFDQITVHVGPGLGKESFSIGQQPLAELTTIFGTALQESGKFKNDKKGQPKYVLDVPGLMTKYAELFGFKVHITESQNTFDKSAWKEIKNKALAEKNPTLPLEYYKNRMFFSARLFVRCVRHALRVAEENHLPLPEEIKNLPSTQGYNDLKNASANYSTTGRCLNGVMRK